MEERRAILKEAEDCVCGKREEDYGTPEDNFAKIANLWNAYLGDNLVTGKDVGLMLALLKIARAKTERPTIDCFVDLAGYAACAGEIVIRKEKR